MGKKIISSICLAVAVFALLCGCSSNDENKVMSQIEKEQRIKVAVSKDDRPYSFGTSDYDGIEVRIAKEIAKDLGVEIELVPTEREGLLSALNNGSAHIALGRLHNEMVSEYNVSLSVSYLSGNVYTVTKRGVVLSTLGALSEKNVICSDKLSSTTIGTIESTGALTYANDSTEDVASLLKEGLIDAYICYDDEAVQYMKDEAVQAQVITNVEREDYVVVIPKNNEKLMNAINKTLTNLLDNGIINDIVDYFQK